MKKISNLIILLVALIVFLNDSSTYLIADHLDKYDGNIDVYIPRNFEQQPPREGPGLSELRLNIMC